MKPQKADLLNPSVDRPDLTPLQNPILILLWQKGVLWLIRGISPSAKAWIEQVAVAYLNICNWAGKGYKTPVDGEGAYLECIHRLGIKFPVGWGCTWSLIGTSSPCQEMLVFGRKFYNLQGNYAFMCTKKKYNSGKFGSSLAGKYFFSGLVQEPPTTHPNLPHPYNQNAGTEKDNLSLRSALCKLLNWNRRYFKCKLRYKIIIVIMIRNGILDHGNLKVTCLFCKYDNSILNFKALSMCKETWRHRYDLDENWKKTKQMQIFAFHL